MQLNLKNTTFLNVKTFFKLFLLNKKKNKIISIVYQLFKLNYSWLKDFKHSEIATTDLNWHFQKKIRLSLTRLPNSARDK
jgi:hypothetical protein